MENGHLVAETLISIWAPSQKSTHIWQLTANCRPVHPVCDRVHQVAAYLRGGLPGRPRSLLGAGYHQAVVTLGFGAISPVATTTLKTKTFSTSRDFQLSKNSFNLPQFYPLTLMR